METYNFTQLRDERRESKKKLMETMLRQVQREQEANRRSYCINTPRDSMHQFVKTRYER